MQEEAEPSPEGANDKTISFSYQGKGEVLKLKSEVVDGFKAQMIEDMLKALKAFDKNIFDALKIVMDDEDQARIKDLNMCNFSSLQRDFLRGAEEVRQYTQVGAVLGPLCTPLPIMFSYDGKNEFLEPEAEAVADFYAWLIDIMIQNMKASLNKKIYESLKIVMTDGESGKFNNQRKCGFSEVHKHLAKLRKGKTEEEAEPLPEGGNFNEEAVKTFPSSIKFSYNGEDEALRPEDGTLVAGFFSSVRGHKYTPEAEFNTLIFSHLQKVMTDEQKKLYINPDMFVFSNLLGYLQVQADLRKEMTKEKREWFKFETARKLKKRLKKIRDAYKKDWVHIDPLCRQRGVALFFIDKLAFRAGNEKEIGVTADEEKEGETAVGCCNLTIDHIKLKGNFVKFDFVGKSKISYQKRVPVAKEVRANIYKFMIVKKAKQQLFDKVKPSYLNTYLNTHMPGLTTKVFRTCNASITLQDKLKQLTDAKDSIPSKLLAFKSAVNAAADLLNHRSAASEDFDELIASLQDKIKAKMTAIKNAKQDLTSVQNKCKKSMNQKMERLVEDKKKAVERLEDQLAKLEAKYKEGSKGLNTDTTMDYYLDPRIIVAWCKKWEIPEEKVYNGAQMVKFKWAIDMKKSLQRYVF